MVEKARITRCNYLLYLGLCLLLFSTRLFAEKAVSYEIEGLKGELKGNAALFLEALPDIPPDALDDYRPEIEEALKKSLRALGYYQPVIHLPETMSDKSTADKKIVKITVDPGQSVLVRTLKVTLLGDAGKDLEFEKFITQQPLKVGGVMHDGIYESLKAGLNDLVMSRGYFNAKLTENQIKVHLDEHAADVLLTLNAGKRHSFGPIIYDPSVMETTQTLLNTIIDFEAGEKYHSDRLSLLNKNLSATGYFKTIDIRPLAEQSKDEAVPVSVRVVPKTAWELETGIGLSSDEGLRLSLAVDKPWMNEQGHSFASELKLSQGVQELGGRYKIPSGNPLRDYYTLDSGYKRTVIEDTNSQLLTASINRWKKRPGNWNQNFFLRLDYEDYTQGEQSSQNLLLIPGLSLDRRIVEGNPLNPESGSRYDVKIETSARIWQSDVDFLKVWGRGKWLTTLYKGHRLLARAEQGAIRVSRIEDIPPSIRFFAGGEQSVRGYKYESISPKDSSGQLMGGRYLSALSLEYDYEFRKNWRVALFVDSGTVTNDYQDDWKVGVGPGIRWVSPLGPLHLDIAFAVSEPGSPWRLHFTIGPDL